MEQSCGRCPPHIPESRVSSPLHAPAHHMKEPPSTPHSCSTKAGGVKHDGGLQCGKMCLSIYSHVNTPAQFLSLLHFFACRWTIWVLLTLWCHCEVDLWPFGFEISSLHCYHHYILCEFWQSIANEDFRHGQRKWFHSAHDLWPNVCQLLISSSTGQRKNWRTSLKTYRILCDYAHQLQTCLHLYSTYGFTISVDGSHTILMDKPTSSLGLQNSFDAVWHQSYTHQTLCWWSTSISK